MNNAWDDHPSVSILAIEPTLIAPIEPTLIAPIEPTLTTPIEPTHTTTVYIPPTPTKPNDIDLSSLDLGPLSIQPAIQPAVINTIITHPPPIENYASPTKTTKRQSTSSKINSPSLKSYPTVTVSDPLKVTDTLSSYISYRLETIPTPYSNQLLLSRAVRRRYSDFLSLFHLLVNKYPGLVIPACPEKSTFSRFNQDFVDMRREMLDRFISRVVRHEMLVNDDDLIRFLMDDVWTFKQGIMRFFQSDKLHVDGELGLDKKIVELDLLDGQLKNLQKNLESIKNIRQGVYN